MPRKKPSANHAAKWYRVTLRGRIADNNLGYATSSTIKANGYDEAVRLATGNLREKYPHVKFLDPATAHASLLEDYPEFTVETFLNVF